MKWSFILSWYNFFVLYLLKNQNERADALSRHEQDMLTGFSDDRVQHCMMQIIHSEMMSKSIQAALMTVVNILIPVLIQDQNLFSKVTNLKQMWVNAETRDKLYKKLCQTIQKQQRSFFTVLKVRVSITKCFLSNEEKLLFDERCWVLFSESLCMKLIQYTHDSTMIRHSKRDIIDALLL